VLLVLLSLYAFHKEAWLFLTVDGLSRRFCTTNPKPLSHWSQNYRIWSVGTSMFTTFFCLCDFPNFSPNMNVMQKSPSWEADCFSASHVIDRILLILKVHCMFIATCYLSLCWARWIQSTSPYPVSWRSIVYASTCRPPKWYLSFRLLQQNRVCVSFVLLACYILCPSYPRLFYYTNIWWGDPYYAFFLQLPVTSAIVGPILEHLQLMYFPYVREQVSHASEQQAFPNSIFPHWVQWRFVFKRFLQ
jgi:hypothetical protein